MLEENVVLINNLTCGYGLGPDEYNRISACATAKEMWDALKIAHERTNQVKQCKIELPMTDYGIVHCEGKMNPSGNQVHNHQ